MNHFTFLMQDICFSNQLQLHIPCHPSKILLLHYDDGSNQLLRFQKRRPPRLIKDAEKMDREIISEILYNMTSSIISLQYSRSISWIDNDHHTNPVKSIHETWSSEDYDRSKIVVDAKSFIGMKKCIFTNFF